MKFKITLLIAFGFSQLGWGFFAHKKINRLAVFTLPPEIFFFYKENINYLTEKAVNPDMRRYIIKEEAPRHYIDLDVYGDSAVYKLPRYWKEAVEKLTEDTLNAYGVVPWHINRVSYQLSLAFLNKDAKSILRFSADLGHYIADANVPLHTTENYNGQFTGQYGIHGFWESRLPELFFNNYDLLSGKAKYIENTQLAAWHAVAQAHASLDSVLRFEKELTDKFNKSKKYSFEERGAITVKVYSYNFSEEYHERLNGMVERRMLAAIKMVGDFWYTAWVDGGQPDLKPLTRSIETTQDSVEIVAEEIKLRNHESGELVQD